MRYSDPKFPRKMFFVGVTFFTLGFFGFVAMLVKKVLSGQGHYHYFSGFGYQFNYIGTLWLVGLVLLLILIVVFIQLRADREERDFLRQFEKKRTK